MEPSLEQLYTNHFRSLYRFAVGLTGNVDEAQDIVQTVFMRLAAKSEEQLSVTPGYLFAAVRNGARDFWKRKQAIPFSHISHHYDTEESFDVPDDETPGPTELSETRIAFQGVTRALSELTEEQREIISLKYFSGYSCKEIAEKIDKQENAVRQMEFRALRALRTALHNLST